jgi:hypothetical protein
MNILKFTHSTTVVYLPKLNWSILSYKPRKISEDDLYIFSIPFSNLKVYKLKFKLYKNSIIKDYDKLIVWIAGDKVVMDKKILHSLSIKLSFDQIKLLNDACNTNNDFNNFNLLYYQESIDLWSNDEEYLYLDMEIYSMCRDIRVKLNPDLLHHIEEVVLQVKKGVIIRNL